MKCSAVQYIRIRAAFDWSICHTTREQWQKLRSAQRGSRGCNEDTDMKYTRALPREASPRASAVSSCPAANCLCRSRSGPRLLGSRANGPHMMMGHWPVTHIHIGPSGGKQSLRASPIAREAEQRTRRRGHVHLFKTIWNILSKFRIHIVLLILSCSLWFLF